MQTQVELLWTWLSIDLITCYVSLTFWGLRKWLQRVFITSFFIIIRRGNTCWPCMQQRSKRKVLQTSTAIENGESGHAAAGVHVVLTQRKVNRCYFLLLIYRSECVKYNKVAVSRGTFIQSGFTKLWQSRQGLSFFFEGLKSHCDMWIFRCVQRGLIRTRLIINANFYLSCYLWIIL